MIDTGENGNAFLGKNLFQPVKRGGRVMRAFHLDGAGLHGVIVSQRRGGKRNCKCSSGDNGLQHRVFPPVITCVM
jgi:hypothetical protein